MHDHEDREGCHHSPALGGARDGPGWRCRHGLGLLVALSVFAAAILGLGATTAQAEDGWIAVPSDVEPESPSVEPSPAEIWASAESELIPDSENCLLCHRYPTLGRYERDGTRRVFYVNDRLYARSVHGGLACTNCHVGLDRIPHGDCEPVDCTTRCHVKEPSTNIEFSHEEVASDYGGSVHGALRDGEERRFSEDLPDCKYCHSNRILTPMAGGWESSQALFNETLSRCESCHPADEWASEAYLHVTHRMRRRREPAEVVALCTSCHEDSEKMARHGLESVATFKDTFHWSLVKFQAADAPDCISCHVPLHYSTHTIRPMDDPISSIHQENRVATCANEGGLQTCHPNATANFVSGRVHAYGEKAALAASFGNSDDAGTGLFQERADASFHGTELFRYRVIALLRLAYKLLIAVVIGSMVLHQVLDYRRAKLQLSSENH